MLTVPKAARRAGRNPETIRRWIRSGRLRARKVGRQHVLEEEGLDAMLRRDEITLPPPPEWRETFWGGPMPGLDRDRATTTRRALSDSDRNCVTLRHMEQVGMRALRHRLREYLARVEAGERFEVTLFGRTVAQLQPPNGRPGGLAQLIAEGRVTPPLNPDTKVLPTPVPSTTRIGPTATLLAERDADPR